MKSITRTRMLYKSGIEYADFSLNHVLGCSHGCNFPCYAFMQKLRFNEIQSYEEWCDPKIVSNAVSLLNSEIPKFKDQIKSVFLCSATDPFMFGFDEVQNLSLNIIKLLNEKLIRCIVLTKGILPKSLANNFHPFNEYGITLVSLDEDYRRYFEPNAAPLKDRLQALKFLHKNNCRTWVSIEPYPTPNIIDQNLFELLKNISFVDKIIFGRTNYSKIVSNFKDRNKFYAECVYILKDFCTNHNIELVIKNGTIKKR